MTNIQPLNLDELRQLASADGLAEQQVARLLSALENDDPEWRGWVDDALRKVEKIAAKEIPLLLERMQHSDPMIAGWACRLSTKQTAVDTEVQQAICHVLEQHPDPIAQQDAVLALTKCDPWMETTESLIQRVSNSAENPRLRRLASQALSDRSAA